MRYSTLLAGHKIRIFIIMVASTCLLMVYPALRQGYTGALTPPSEAFTTGDHPNTGHLPLQHEQPETNGDHIKNIKGHQNGHLQKELHLHGSTALNQPNAQDTMGLLVKEMMSENKVNTVASNQKILMQSEIKNKIPEKVVLLWNKHYGHNFDMIGINGQRHICPRAPKCTFTHNKTLLAKADALVFYMWPEDQWEFPKMRTANQQYVFLQNESPVRREYHLEWYDHFFNLTMTYRRDSDIPFLYGNIYPKKSPVLVTEPGWLAEMAVMKAKKKLVAWSVSHCRTDSKREEYVEELKKHIPVDIYGRCGTLKCWPPMSSKCYDMIRKDYRFVLAFENSACKDYITEKVYENLNAGVVPIVYGGANYEEMLPPHSFIDVRHFASPKHLGGYLKHLMHNDAEYLKYFQWKRSFFLSTQNHEWELSFCKLCKFLHHPIQRHKSYSTNDLKAHWGPWNCNSNYLKQMREFWIP